MQQLHRKTKKIKSGLNQGLSVSYQTQIINPDGSIAKKNPWTNNLILDVGLDMVAADDFAALTVYAVAGTGNTPVSRDSATTTLTRSGTTVTASASYFVSQDVGRILKFDTGEEMYITSYTSVTEVEVDTSGALGASEGTIWYVNETGHGNEVVETATSGLDSGDNSSTALGAVVTHQRTKVFPPEVGPVTYTEIGWRPDNFATNPDLFGRDLVTGGGDSLIAGQQYKVIIRLAITFDPVNPTVISDIGTGGLSSAGVACFSYLQFAVRQINADGSMTSTSQDSAEPSAQAIHRHYGTDAIAWTPLTGITLSSAAGTVSGDRITGTVDGYGAGNHYRDVGVVAGISDWNGVIRSICFGSANSGNTVRAFEIVLDSDQTKDSDHTLTLTFRLSWSRSLTN